MNADCKSLLKRNFKKACVTFLGITLLVIVYIVVIHILLRFPFLRRIKHLAPCKHGTFETVCLNFCKSLKVTVGKVTSTRGPHHQ